jgi:rhamnosyltransferase subunit B
MLAWELGEGLGHVQRLLRVALPLQADGHVPVLVLCNTIEPWSLLRETGLPVLQAPVCGANVRIAELKSAGFSLADILALRGWDAVDRLLPTVMAWQRLLEMLQPRVVVADFSPTACLAAFRKLPTVVVGSGFSVPPLDQGEFPSLTPGPSATRQDQMLAVAQDVQRLRRDPVPVSLTDILAQGECFAATLPELDPYAGMRAESVWDPLEPLLTPPPVPHAPHFFAYLSADFPQVELVVTELALTGCRGTVYLRSAAAAVRERLKLQGLEMLDKPASMTSMLTKASVVVHHGGLGLAQAALAAGRPQILLPQHLEQFTTSEHLRKLGAGVNVTGSVTPQGGARALAKILAEPRFAGSARAAADKIHARPRRDPLPVILERCRHHLDVCV